MHALKVLRTLLSREDKKLLLLLGLFSLFVSLVEVIGIGAIMPFLFVVSDFSIINSNPYYNFFYQLLSFSNAYQFVIVFGVLLILFYLLRSAVNLWYVYSNSKFTYRIYIRIISQLFNKFYTMSYADFTKTNLAILRKTLFTETSHLVKLISTISLIFSEVLVVLLIYGFILFVDYLITLGLTLFLILNSVFMLKVISKRIKYKGDIREKTQKKHSQIIEVMLGNFKLSKLHHYNIKINDKFYQTSKDFADVNIYYQTWNLFPRFYLEAIGFSLIILILLYFVSKGSASIPEALPIVSIFIIALYRIMRSFNSIILSINNIAFLYKSPDIISKSLSMDSEKLGSEAIAYNSKIVLKNIDFAYEKNNSILTDINLTINKGDKIAISGKSGSGKTTLVDIIIGLYTPNKGSVVIDDTTLTDKNRRQWRDKIGYIPQSIYLFNGSIKDNITLDSLYDRHKVDRCLKQVNIYDFLQTKQGQDTLVGDRGVQLSGGQKQRVAIARALYHDPEVLVLDEATSALDSKTENLIMKEIYQMARDKTLIIIAHRTSTTKQCDMVYKVENGRLVK